MLSTSEVFIVGILIFLIRIFLKKSRKFLHQTHKEGLHLCAGHVNFQCRVNVFNQSCVLAEEQFEDLFVVDSYHEVLKLFGEQDFVGGFDFEIFVVFKGLFCEVFQIINIFMRVFFRGTLIFLQEIIVKLVQGLKFNQNVHLKQVRPKILSLFLQKLFYLFFLRLLLDLYLFQNLSTKFIPILRLYWF